MVQETGFDAEANDGIGNAFIRRVDIHNILFDPLYTDIQSSRAIFKFAPYPRAWFLQHYPEKAKDLEEDAFNVMVQQDAYLNRGEDDSILLIECWQREYNPETRRHSIHMCKLAGKQVLESSRSTKPEGYYAHGLYPFTVTPLFVRKGTPLGFGFVDMFKTQQKYSDKLDQIVMKNALLASHNKLLVTHASGFDVNDLRDWAKEVHKGENLNGVTAASAIAALQEASSKRSRMIARAVHGAYEEAVRQEIEVEREFAEFPRTIALPAGSESTSSTFSGALMYELSGLNNRLPLEFVVTVKAQRENRFSMAAHNELIIKLVQLQMITPDVGLELMFFDGKIQAQELMRRKTEQMQALQQENAQMQAELA